MRRRGGWRKGFGERLGRYSTKFKQAISNRDVIWLHAVSVGEVNVCVQLIKVLQPRLPNLKLVVSTTTTTGMSELHKKLSADVGKIYYPMDRRVFVRRAFATIRPKAVVLVEAEIWPNFLWGLQARDIPHFLVNTRISGKSYQTGIAAFVFCFAASSPGSPAWVPKANTMPSAWSNSGATAKWCTCLVAVNSTGLGSAGIGCLDVPSLLRSSGRPQGRAVARRRQHARAARRRSLAGLAKRLREKHPDLFLVLVPRHAERGREVGDALAKLGVRFIYRSEIGSNMPPKEQGRLDCLLVNTTGELKFFYEEAAVVFIGKSLTAQGGQNPIEPAGLARPIVFGPHMGNFAEITV